MAETGRAAARTPLFLALGFVLCFEPALAQRPDTTAQRRDTTLSAAALKQLSIEQLLNVEVTSVSKRPERLAQAAAAIQVITQDDIRRSGASSLPEALRLATNLQVAQIDARQWAISARGFNSTTANKLLVLIDGRTVYTPLYSGVFWDVQDVPLVDVDRIEVISGPGATLWGANAVNGVINVITRSSRDTPGPLVSGGGGNELRGFGTARYGGALGPRWGYRVYGKGFARQPTVLPSGLDAGNDWHFEQGGFRMDGDASSATHLSVHGDFYDGRISQPSASDIAVSGGNLAGTWSHTLSANSDIQAQLYYDHTHRNIPGVFGEELDTYNVDLQHRTLVGERHNLVWGLGYRLINDRVANSVVLAFLPAHVRRKWFSGFVQDEIAIVPARLQLALGTKIEHNDYTGWEWQPSGRVNWTVSQSATLWTAVSRALRTPSRIDREFFLPSQPPYFLAGGPNFHSEEERAYELGYRLQRGALTLALATFYNRYHGLRSIEKQNPPAATPLVLANGQEGESYGGELAAEYRVSDSWRVRAGYTDLRIQIWALPGSTDTSRGNGENHTPNRQFSLRSSADFGARWSLDGQFRYVGEITNQQLPAYGELDVRLAWHAARELEVSVHGRNLLHDHHAEFGTPPAPPAPPARWEIERSVYGMIEWRF
jgi:iron complex outermembrane recepter protein